MKNLIAVLIVLTISATSVFAQSAGDFVITEWQSNPSAVGDGNGEYIELYNTTAGPIDLQNYIITDDGTDTHTISLSVVVPAGGLVVLGNDGNSATNGGYTADYDYSGSGAVFLGNGADEIVILSPDGLTEICRVNFTNGDFAGAGVAVELDDVTLYPTGVTAQANYSGATGTYGLGDNGSPGTLGGTVPVELSIFSIE